MLKVYLGGSITGKSYKECTEWRNWVAERLYETVEIINPLRGKDYLINEKEISQSYETTLMSTGKAIYGRDSFDVSISDILLFNFLGAIRVSIGSIFEMGWGSAPSVSRKIIITVMEKDNIHQHRFVQQVSNWMPPDLETAIEIIEYIAARKNLFK